MQGEAPQRRLLAWRDRVGHLIDVLPSRSDLERPQVGELVFTDCQSDMIVLERSLARISTDRVLALDMNQPIRMQRQACRVLAFFVPGELVQEVVPDPEAIHARVLHGSTPLARLIIEHVAMLSQNIACMTASGRTAPYARRPSALSQRLDTRLT